MAGVQVAPGAPAWFHPGRSGLLQFGPKNVVGAFGEVHPKALKALDLKGPLVAFEIALDALPPPKYRPTKMKPKLQLSEFQPVTRDFAFVVARDVAAADILKAAQGAERQLVTGIEVFDVYEGSGIDPDKKSVAIAVTLQPAGQDADGCGDRGRIGQDRGRDRQEDGSDPPLLTSPSILIDVRSQAAAPAADPTFCSRRRPSFWAWTIGTCWKISNELFRTSPGRACPSRAVNRSLKLFQLRRAAPHDHEKRLVAFRLIGGDHSSPGEAGIVGDGRKRVVHLVGLDPVRHPDLFDGLPFGSLPEPLQTWRDVAVGQLGGSHHRLGELCEHRLQAAHIDRRFGLRLRGRWLWRRRLYVGSELLGGQAGPFLQKAPQRPVLVRFLDQLGQAGLRQLRADVLGDRASHLGVAALDQHVRDALAERGAARDGEKVLLRPLAGDGGEIVVAEPRRALQDRLGDRRVRVAGERLDDLARCVADIRQPRRQLDAGVLLRILRKKQDHLVEDRHVMVVERRRLVEEQVRQLAQVAAALAYLAARDRFFDLLDEGIQHAYRGSQDDHGGRPMRH